MQFIPLLLVVASAASHASWNVITKKSLDKRVFLWWMNLTSLFTMIPIFYFLLPELILPLEIVPYLVVSSFAETLYFLFLGKAYELGDLSVVYPVARSSPLFLFVFAVIYLNESVTVWGIGGILLVVLGVYMMHLRSLSYEEFLKPIVSIRSRASQFALLSALCTTVYSLMDKVSVTHISPVLYAFWLDIFIVFFFTPIVLLTRGRIDISTEWKKYNLRILLSGFLMRFGYVLVLLAMSITQVSYVLSIRQMSVVFGVVLGVVLLGERYGRIRLISSLIILTGILILGII